MGVNIVTPSAENLQLIMWVSVKTREAGLSNQKQHLAQSSRAAWQTDTQTHRQERSQRYLALKCCCHHATPPENKAPGILHNFWPNVFAFNIVVTLSRKILLVCKVYYVLWYGVLQWQNNWYSRHHKKLYTGKTVQSHKTLITIKFLVCDSSLSV